MTEPECVITGCALFQGDTWVACDLFDLGEFWLVNANVRVTEGGSIGLEWFDQNIVKASYSKRITIIDDCPFWERRAVFVIHKSCAVLNQAALDYIK
jgi:hypothetical protein